MATPSRPTGAVSRTLSTRPNILRLKKEAKALLKEMRRVDPATKLAVAQFALAREYGFSSWRSLRAHLLTHHEASERQPHRLRYPIVPIRDVVVFPGAVVPLLVGREKSKEAVEYALADKKEIFLISQRATVVEEPHESDLYQIGTIARIMDNAHLSDDMMKVIVFGLRRARLHKLSDNTAFVEGDVQFLDDVVADPDQLPDMQQALLDASQWLAEQSAPDRSEAWALSLAERMNSPESIQRVEKMQEILESGGRPSPDISNSNPLE